MNNFNLTSIKNEPEDEQSAVNKRYTLNKLDLKLDKTIKADLDMGGRKIKKYPNSFNI